MFLPVRQVPVGRKYPRGSESAVLRSRSGKEEVWPHQPTDCLVCDKYDEFVRQEDNFQ